MKILNFKKLFTLLGIALIISCQQKEDISIVSELNNNEELLNKVKFNNDNVYFGWTFYNYRFDENYELNVNIHNNAIDSVRAQEKLKNDSQKILSELKNYADLSSFKAVNFYLHSNKKIIDTLKIDL